MIPEIPCKRVGGKRSIQSIKEKQEPSLLLLQCLHHFSEVTIFARIKLGGIADRAAENEITKLAPYPAWSSRHVPDPRVADPDVVGKELYELIEIEGPVLVARAYRLYSRACGLQRVGRQVQAGLNKALSRLIRSNQVVVENERDEPGLIHAVARLSGTERIRLRERGPRTFEEIPQSELAEQLRSIREELFDVTEEELGRELLERYGLVRMTRQVRDTLSQACNGQLS